MSNHDIVHNNLIFHTDNGSYIFTNNRNKPIRNKEVVVKINNPTDKTKKYIAYGQIISQKGNLTTVEINNTEKNTIFTENPSILTLSYKNDFNHKTSFIVNGKPMEFDVALYKIVSKKDSFVENPSRKEYNVYNITLGMIMKNKLSKVIPQTLKTLSMNRKNIEQVPLLSDYELLENKYGGKSCHKKHMKGGMCGKKTKSGTLCKNKSNCRYH